MQLLNKYKSSLAEQAQATYIGRGSPLGNPYVIGTHGTREEVIKMYRTWLINKIISRDPGIEVAIRSLKPNGSLLCFCVPQPCHGEVISEYHEVLFSKEDYEAGLAAFKEIYSKERILYRPEDDGVTHINVYSKGKTEIGRQLSNFANVPFEHPQYGHFSSIEGFWYWLSLGKVRNDFRSLYGFKAKETGKIVREEVKKLGKVPHVENFEAQIKKAILCKITQSQNLIGLLKENKLPFTHYYHWGEGEKLKVTYPEDYAWVHEYISLVRDWIQGNAQRVLVAGSRDIADYDLVKEAYLESGYNAVEFVSGLARGPDRLSLRLASELKLPVAEFPADWDTEPKAAGFIRNAEMANYLKFGPGPGVGVLVWDGVSGGTKNMMDLLVRNNLKYFMKELSGVTTGTF